MPPLGLIINACWLCFLLVWLIASFRIKPDVRDCLWLQSRGRGRWLSWRARNPLFLPRLALTAVLLLMIAALVANRGEIHKEALLFRAGPAFAWVASALTVAGIGFAIWARLHLGRNWSARPAVKEGHELVTTGPYALVRHPIYTGLLIAVLGLAFAGSLMGMVSLVCAIVVFLRRYRREEQLMMTLFSQSYPAYRLRTKRLIPLVW